jgi:4-carboxymuconolactone decarboxylase
MIMPETNGRWERGLTVRREVLGSEHVDRAVAAVSDFSLPVQVLVTEMCWGDIWSRPDLERRTRSLLNLVMLTALNRMHEFGVHVRGAVRNGCTVVEIQEALLQTAVYCGAPAALESFRVAELVLAEMQDGLGSASSEGQSRREPYPLEVPAPSRESLMSSTADMFAIERLSAEYNRAGDEGRVDDWVACFTPDGVFARTDTGASWQGADQLRAMSTAYPVAGRHVTTDFIIDLSPDGRSATQSCSLLFFDRAAGFALHMVGTYADELVKVGGEWRFAVRKLSAEVVTPSA